MAKTRSIDDRMAASRMPTLVDDDEFEDFLRPENYARPRAGKRAGTSHDYAASSPADYAESGARSRARSSRVRASMLQDAEEGDAFEHDPEHEEESAFLRSRRRVPVRRNVLLATRWGRIALALSALASLGLLLAAFLFIRGFFLHDPRFRIGSASSIQIAGNSELSRSELLGVFGADVGHNIFEVPLAERRAALQELPWVRNAIVMRLWPNQLRVAVVERTPAAFVREGNKVQLVDGSGVILSMAPAMLAARHYSFPVVLGISANDPPGTRLDRMQLYGKFVSALDGAAGAQPVKVSQQLSEVDVSDPEDVRATMPSAGSDILVHFGDDDFAKRYTVYKEHLASWRQQYPHLAAIDLRYDRQTVLEMAKSSGQDTASADTTPTLSATPAIKPPARRTAPKKPLHTTRPVVKTRKVIRPSHTVHGKA